MWQYQPRLNAQTAMVRCLLITAIDGFFERPPVRIFKCEKCSRLVMFFLENGSLRKT